MLGFVRLVIAGFLVLTVIYFCLSLYSRALRRDRLRRKWQQGPKRIDRDAFVARGLKKYDASIRRKLLLGVYVVPVFVVGLIIYLTNFS
ncbi:hypothetical protein ACFSUD_15735 [Sulfitobacter aestuarii]|uniref:Cation/multidrug efflux pump n=1 Tax=Sulfitobacter aestuarii TaxID=2161676 RepID=A0ABW5U5Y7_9RHOB